MVKNFRRLGEKIGFTTIRGRLLISFILMTLLPALAIGAGSILVGYSNGRQQVFDQLVSLLALKEQEIGGWTAALKSELTAAVEQEYIFERIRVVLYFAEEEYYLDFYTKSVRSRMQQFLLNAQYFDEIALLDLEGHVVLSTNIAHEGQSHASEDYFKFGLQDKTVRFSDRLGGSSETIAVAAQPVYGDSGIVLGVVIGVTDLSGLQAKLDQRTGLGSTGKAYLVGEDYQSIAATGDLFADEPLLPSKPASVVLERQDGGGFYEDVNGTQVAGVYRWLPDLDAALFVEKDLSEAFGVIFETLRVNLIVAVLALALAVIASLMVTDSIARPIMGLSQRAAGIAEGDWEQIEQVERRDELGVLARALDSMMAQLRALIGNLEQRVEERTGQLQEANQAIRTRALQLETSASVSREITSILERNVLLERIAQLIRESFDFYAVNIFLLDEKQNKLLLNAYQYDDPVPLYRLEMPADHNSLNGRTAIQNEAVLVNNVLESSDFQYDPLLPGTKSELVIPLRIAGKVIGTLDLQASKVSAFTLEDLPVFQSLGDQIAIAIENARLVESNQKLAVIDERNRLARELHDSVIQSLYSLTLLGGGWSRFSPAEKAQEADVFVGEFSEIARQALKEMRLLVYNLRPPVLEQEGLLGALHARLDAVEKRAGIQTRLIADDLSLLDSATQECVYRIA